jgi:hypothetical protein
MRRTETREYVFLRAGRVPFWRVAVAAVLALAFVAALAILVSGLFLILLPAIAAGAIAARFLGWRVSTPPRTEVIEAEYEVIEEKRDKRETPPSGDLAH